MSNSHYAVTIGASMDMTLVASGPEAFCAEQLAIWLTKHPLEEFGSSEILKRDPSAVKHLDPQPGDALYVQP